MNKIKLKLINWLIRGIEKEQKHELLTELVAKSFNTISEKDILQQQKGEWVYGDKILQKNEIMLLKSEVSSLLNMKLWRVLQTDIKYQANRMMFLKSKNGDDLIAGKFIIYTLDIIKSVLNRITQAK